MRGGGNVCDTGEWFRALSEQVQQARAPSLERSAWKAAPDEVSSPASDGRTHLVAIGARVTVVAVRCPHASLSRRAPRALPQYRRARASDASVRGYGGGQRLNSLCTRTRDSASVGSE